MASPSTKPLAFFYSLIASHYRSGIGNTDGQEDHFLLLCEFPSYSLPGILTHHREGFYLGPYCPICVVHNFLKKITLSSESGPYNNTIIHIINYSVFYYFLLYSLNNCFRHDIISKCETLHSVKHNPLAKGFLECYGFRFHFIIGKHSVGKKRIVTVK